MLGDLVDGVVGRDVQRQRGAAHLRRGLPEGIGRTCWAFHVDADDLGAVAREHLGDGRTDAAGGSRHDRYLAVQRLVPVGRRRRVGGADPEHLPVDVGRLA